MVARKIAVISLLAGGFSQAAFAQPSLSLQPFVGTGTRSSLGEVTQVSGAECVAALYRVTSESGLIEFSPLLEIANLFVSGRLDEKSARQSEHFDIKSLGAGAHVGIRLSDAWLTQLGVTGGRGLATLQSDRRSTAAFSQTTFRGLDQTYGKVRLGAAYKAKENIRLLAGLAGTFAAVNQADATGQTKGEETRDGNIYLTSGETASADLLAAREVLKLFTIQFGVEALLP